MMYGHEKSDLAIVAAKLTNKAGRPGAESVEARARAKGNASRQSTHRAQNRDRVSQALERVRQAASDRFAVKHPRWEPYAGNPLVRICAGASSSNGRPYRDHGASPHSITSSSLPSSNGGMVTPAPESVREERRKAAGRQLHVDLLGRAVPAVNTSEGLRALSKDRPIAPASVQRYLESKFGPELSAAVAAMRQLAKSRAPARLAKEGFHLHEQFRPHVPAGVTGWGAAGELDLSVIRGLVKRAEEN